MVTPKQLGHLVIRVRDLEKSEQFYTNVLGLTVMNKRPGVMTFMSADEGMSHELALVPVGEDAPGPESTRVGLFHMAWEMDSFEDLKQLYEVIKENDVTVENVGDHGISGYISPTRTATRSKHTTRCPRTSGLLKATCSRVRSRVA